MRWARSLGCTSPSKCDIDPDPRVPTSPQTFAAARRVCHPARLWEVRIFEAYVEHHLPPTLGEGQVVLDGLRAQDRQGEVAHRSEGSRAVVVAVSSYSPDLNPIEEAFSKTKNIVRKAGARTRQASVEAIAKAISSLTLEDVAGWFAHCGYYPQDQYSCTPL